MGDTPNHVGVILGLPTALYTFKLIRDVCKLVGDTPNHVGVILGLPTALYTFKLIRDVC